MVNNGDLSEEPNDDFWNEIVDFKVGGEMVKITQGQLKDYLVFYLKYRMADCLGVEFVNSKRGLHLALSAWQPFLDRKLICFWQREDGCELMVLEQKE